MFDFDSIAAQESWWCRRGARGRYTTNENRWFRSGQVRRLSLPLNLRSQTGPREGRMLLIPVAQMCRFQSSARLIRVRSLRYKGLQGRTTMRRLVRAFWKSSKSILLASNFPDFRSFSCTYTLHRCFDETKNVQTVAFKSIRYHTARQTWPEELRLQSCIGRINGPASYAV